MKVENRAEKQNMTADCEVILVRNDKAEQNEKIGSISGGIECGSKDCGESGVEDSIRDNLRDNLRNNLRDKRREILREHRLELVVNEQLLARLVCTPDDLENLAVGRLITEGIISDTEEIEQMYLCESGNRARIFLKKNIKLEAVRMEEPTCCTDNRVFLQAAKMASADGDQESTGQGQILSENLPAAVWKREWIFSIVKAFAEDSKLHRSTGGTHSCLLAVEDRVLYVAEDLGRHNAMDKAIGYAAMQGLDREKCILFTTGRVPTDMVKKVLAARIPVLISKAVPTMEAVEMARESGLTLICRAWPDSFEVYAGEA